MFSFSSLLGPRCLYWNSSVDENVWEIGICESSLVFVAGCRCKYTTLSLLHATRNHFVEDGLPNARLKPCFNILMSYSCNEFYIQRTLKSQTELKRRNAKLEIDWEKMIIYQQWLFQKSDRQHSRYHSWIATVCSQCTTVNKACFYILLFTFHYYIIYIYIYI